MSQLKEIQSCSHRIMRHLDMWYRHSTSPGHHSYWRHLRTAGQSV